MKGPHASVRLARPIVLTIVSKSSQRRSLVAMPVAMPTSLVTSNVAAPAMSLDTNFVVQKRHCGHKYKSGLGSDEPTQQIYSTKISIPSTQNSISQ
jgi:hypothetical protein